MLSNKRPSNAMVVIFNKQHNTVVVDKVVDADSDTIEMHGHILPLAESHTYVDPVHGRPVYVYHLDVPAAVEAENLKKLRRSMALKNMFQFERSSSLDIFKLLPWLIMALLIFFK